MNKKFIKVLSIFIFIFIFIFGVLLLFSVSVKILEPDNGQFLVDFDPNQEKDKKSQESQGSCETKEACDIPERIDKGGIIKEIKGNSIIYEEISVAGLVLEQREEKKFKVNSKTRYILEDPFDDDQGPAEDLIANPSPREKFKNNLDEAEAKKGKLSDLKMGDLVMIITNENNIAELVTVKN